MSRLYSSPLRVYLLLGGLAIAGILAGLKLPISLFPNSSKPVINVSLNYGGDSAEHFLNRYGKGFESQLRGLRTEDLSVDKITASYGPERVQYGVHFVWGADAQVAQREVSNAANAFTASLAKESRDSLQVYSWSGNSGFLAVSLYSEKRSLNETYALLEPLLVPRLAKIEDAERAILYNPLRQEVQVQLIPEALASLQLFPKDVELAIDSALASSSGGAVLLPSGSLEILVSEQVNSVDALGKVSLTTGKGKTVHLSDIARIDIGTNTLNAQSFRTSGMPSLILFSRPKPGGNVKKMSEDILATLEELRPSLPPDIQTKTLVDPSQFIRSAINNVLHEVTIAALLAVVVLFFFIGSFKNVATAAVEIPLSMVLAFLLMKLTGININLISLAGLALSAGMNVDASVVVMENIFRHFEKHPGPHTPQARLQILTQAVREVQFPVIASTISSLVVFIPLAFTSNFTYAILGDLALAIVFSHGFSALVALLLVPTVRLQLMSSEHAKAHHSPIERQLVWLEGAYSRTLSRFLESRLLRFGTYLSLMGILAVCLKVILPNLPKEIVGKPDTDWLTISISTQGNTQVRQMETAAQEIEHRLLKKFGSEISYTFAETDGANSSWLMARLKNKSKMRELWKAMEAEFPNTPDTQYFVGPWNPSELPLPETQDIKLSIRGGSAEDRLITARQIRNLLREKKTLPFVGTEPGSNRENVLKLEPHWEQWDAAKALDARLSFADLSDALRVASAGRSAGRIPIDNDLIDIVIRYPTDYLSQVEDVAFFPVAVGPKLIPLNALAKVTLAEAEPTIYRENEREVFYVTGSGKESDEKKSDEPGVLAQKQVQEWLSSQKDLPVTVTFEDAKFELNQAIDQLVFATSLSLALILLTLAIQFGSLMEPILVLVAIPVGLIGVILGLFLFKSTLSLNSALGVILLNGIAVANSIILVDFIKRLVAEGMSPKAAATLAAKTRLRPILITSLTTILGMLPIALGFGEGGRILQPLGITVSAGLWVSTLLTLFLVPALHVSYLERNIPDPGKRSIWSWLSFRLSGKLRFRTRGEEGAI